MSTNQRVFTPAECAEYVRRNIGIVHPDYIVEIAQLMHAALAPEQSEDARRSFWLLSRDSHRRLSPTTRQARRAIFRLVRGNSVPLDLGGVR